MYIYLLEYCNSTYYIGKTNDIVRRIKEHTKNSSIEFKHIILDEVEDKQWKFWEKYWICQFKTWGFALMNKNNGGGGTRAGIKRSEECKNKISIALSNRNITWNTKISQNKTGIKHNRINPMPKHIIDNLPKKDIIQEYTLNHKSAKDISLMYNVSTVTIINLLKQNNIQPTKNKINDDTKQQIIKEYNKHYNINILVPQFDLSRVTIKNHLQQWGVFKDQRKIY
jgi:hypothetical protein